MARFLWDTSALIRRYILTEMGSKQVIQVTAFDAGNRHQVSRLLPTEVASALSLKLRTGAVDAAERDAHWWRFLSHLQLQYEVLELTSEVFVLAQELLFRHPLRTNDAIHLATALRVRALPSGGDIVFWTADRRQAEAAAVEGLTVELLG